MTSQVDTTAATESVVVEAPTVEAALEAVASQIGTDCLILGVEKVARGGIAGFFGKETYQVEVRRPVTPLIDAAVAQPRTQAPASSPEAVARQAVDRVLEAAADARTGAEDTTFGEVLRGELAARQQNPVPSPTEADGFDGIDLASLETEAETPVEPEPAELPSATPDALDRLRGAVEQGRTEPEVVIAATPIPAIPSPEPAVVQSTAPAPSPIPAPAPAPAPAPTMPTTRTLGLAGREAGESLFTADHLVRGGLPFSFVVQLGDLSALDDAARLVRLAEALQPWCGPLPGDDALVVGRRADQLAGALAMEVHGPSDALPHQGSAIWISDPNDPATAAYLQQIRGDRRLHLVDPSLETLASLEPGTIVSWSDPSAGFDALLFALERGLHLGFDVSTETARRATSLEVAIGIRSRLPVAGS